MLGHHRHRREHEGAASTPALVLVDKDVDGRIASLKEIGVEIFSEPQEALWEPNRRFAEFRDSEGNRIVLASS